MLTASSHALILSPSGFQKGDWTTVAPASGVFAEAFDLKRYTGPVLAFCGGAAGICQPEEIAQVVLFLAVDESTFGTGPLLLVDAGSSAYPILPIPYKFSIAR